MQNRYFCWLLSSQQECSFLKGSGRCVGESQKPEFLIPVILTPLWTQWWSWGKLLAFQMAYSYFLRQVEFITFFFSSDIYFSVFIKVKIYDPKACVHGCFQVSFLPVIFSRSFECITNKIGLLCLCPTFSSIFLMIFEKLLCFTNNATMALLLKEDFIDVCVRTAHCRVI